VTAADVWLGTGDGTNKSERDWRTLLVFGLGKGVRDAQNVPSFLWSSSPSCDSDFYKKYRSGDGRSYPYYCGYYAFDITDTANRPASIKWRLQPTSEQAKYLDEPWSKMAIGRVKISGSEKWVGFIGGGYNTQGRYDDDDDYDRGKRGKGFFVVDLSNGNILWSYTQGDNSRMDFSIPASPAIVDRDNDGFIDAAYVGDLGGNMWRFTFCTQQDGAGCSMANWRGGKLFDASSAGVIRPIFTTAAIASDASSQLWVFWGTGDKMDPTSRSGQEKFFAVVDSDRTSTYNLNDLQNITTGTYSGAKQGWYLNLAGGGEKVLADPTVFGGIVLFTTYTPGSSSDPCGGQGTGKLYALAMMPIAINGITYNPGAGVLSEPANKSSTAGGERSMTLGSGMPTAPVISQKPTTGTGTPGATDLYVTVSGSPGQDTAIKSSSQFSESPFLKRLRSTPPRAQIIHWRDRRLQ